MFRLVTALSLVTCAQAWQCIVGSTALYVDGGRSRDDYGAACAAELRQAMRAAGAALVRDASRNANLLLPPTTADAQALSAMTITYATEWVTFH